MEIQEAEDEQKFILTGEESPLEGYTNWQPLGNANLEEHNNNNSRNNYECENQQIKLLEDISTPKKNKLERIKDSSKKKKRTKEEKEYFWITQNKKIFPGLHAHSERQYQISTQNEDWTKK
ncbi:hypothetical protein O181_013559 [Austropuccinia psidii MF-1]|uniref:Uncharacterized protein n=1 Tax=Austropuccinia psidii MF-1 TaxID=1389203 RepID=A0A9Q3GNZ5_9BASI|nr:hypothetical protein [Austropuccinia psidii MF-1]